jgi:hypothetical protein
VNNQNPWAAFGDVGHKLREDWLRFGRWPAEPVLVTIRNPRTGKSTTADARACIAEGIAHWPAPGKCNAVELRVDEAELFGVIWTMRLDSVSHYTPGAYVQADDLKTCGDLKYAKTEDQLLADTQRIVYAAWLGTALDVPFVGAQWTYCRRKPPKAVPVTVVESTAAARMRLHVLTETTVRPMLAANRHPLQDFPKDGLEVFRTNPREGCGAYGGCPAMDQCLTATERIADPPASFSVA